MTATAETINRGGRRRDSSRDQAILTATLEVLASVGYDATTIDMVAARAGTVRATVYRRWATKADLIVAAVNRMSSDDAVAAALPDTGTLRGDLLATTVPMSPEQQRLRIDVMSAVTAAGRTEPKIAALTVDAGLAPWVHTSRVLVQRAVDRGEYPRGDVEALASVLPTLCVYRTAVERQPITKEFVTAIVDGVILPAMRGLE